MDEPNGVTRGQGPEPVPGVLHMKAAAPPALERSEARPSPRTAPAVPLARAESGERWISRLLRTGALCSGGLFLLSLVLEALPDTEPVHVAIDLLRKGAASALLVTPVVRLVVAGASLGMRGEWRYTLYAAGVLALLALAMTAGLRV